MTDRMQRRYVLMDRDGVINHDSNLFIKSPEEWVPIEGSLEAIALLNRHDFDIAILTNQSGLARGLFDENTLAGIHAKMKRLAAEKGGVIDAIYYCPHGPEDNCRCRKPGTGLFEAFAAEKKADLNGLFFIGDSLRDVQAAKAAGAHPILVKTGKGEKTLADHPDLAIPVFDNLLEAARYIISKR
ncbi:MAG: D-glycero-beta-D-manno-heptose 1,7-bisphosphate 7-phosphatase [Gammaproteobacteria bacterium]